MIDVLSDLFILRGIPGHIRSDNGPEFVAKAVREWITAVGAKTAYIEPGSPSENGYVESFNARLRDELLDGEIFYTLREAQIVIESWRRHFNTIRPHESLATSRRHPRCSCKDSRVAGCATSTGSAGHAPAGTTANTKLTFRPDHSAGADQNASAGLRKLSSFHEKQRPRMLLSYLLKCGCGGGFSKVSQHHYGCSTARNKGTCHNRLILLCQNF